MTIEIQQPELEDLIFEKMGSGAFSSVEDSLLKALKPTSTFRRSNEGGSVLTGADIIAVMQACPDKDFEFGLPRPHMGEEREVIL